VPRLAAFLARCSQRELRQRPTSCFRPNRRLAPERRGRHRLQYGYLPPRLSQAEAIHEATLMAERYERAFLRLVREFRNARRMFAALVVAEGGTVNVAEGSQLVNIDARTQPTADSTPADEN
jgi:hypothetical protein